MFITLKKFNECLSEAVDYSCIKVLNFLVSMEEYNLSSSSIDNISQFSRIKRLVLRASQDEAFSSSRRRDGFRSSIVSASPILDEKRNTLYLIHTVLINVLTLHHGEEFCAAYLDIQTSTVLTTTISESTVTTVLPASTVTTTTITGTRYVPHRFDFKSLS